VEATSKRNVYWAYSILGLLVLISLAFTQASVYYIYLVAYIWFGVAYGMLLQYGRFCIASASRDLFATGVPRMAVVILVTLVFLSIVQAILAAAGMTNPFFQATPVGVHLLVAGLTFGFGMVIAGGCATGSVYKVGEGHGTSMLALLALIFGQAVFVTTGGFFNRLLPQSWVDSAATKTWAPGDKLTSWYDTYLVGYVFDKPSIQLSKTGFIESNLSGVSRFLIGDALLNTIIPAMLLLIAIYVFFNRKGFIKKRKKAKGTTGFADELAGIWNMITASKRTLKVGLLLSLTIGLHIVVAKGLHMKFGIDNFGQLLAKMGHAGDVTTAGKIFDPGYWFMTTQQSQLGAWVLDVVGFNMRDNTFFGLLSGLPAPWRNPALWMTVGIILGAMVTALINREFKFNIPKGELIVWGLLGGLLLGIGARLALGCAGAFFVRIAGGDFGAWMFFLSMVGGAYFGVRFFNWWTDRKMAKEMGSIEF